MQSTPASPLVQNGNSPAALQSHIYTSFLERKTADVALYVHGTWRAIYRLHRVVLIQAGFFQSLFTAGFSESRIKPGGHRLEPDVIDIVLEDPNITRAAFEICIARLYGGGPALFISPSLIATPKYPLTPSFPTSSVSRLEPRAVHISCPADQHPASPRFLLSILATSLFLSIPSVASQAITLILKTVGPGTAVRYLNFAIGKGIGEPEHEEPAAAVGLETVAELLKDDDEDSILECNESPIETPRAMSSEELSDKLKDLNMEFHSYAESNADRTGLGIQKEGPSDVASEASLNIGHTRHVAEPVLFYGAVSDKIGEASACWLARWGADMLRYEQQDLFGEEIPTVVTPASPIPTMRKRATTVPSHRIPGGGIPNLRPNPSQSRVTEWTKMTAPVVWRRGGLTARWVRGLLSSDSLFVQDEKERYDMSCAVAELRRAEGILPEEETEFDILFTKGIYYANMSLDDLMTIAKDISPSTSLPYVPIKSFWVIAFFTYLVNPSGFIQPSQRSERVGHLDIYV
ncbi:hypothetical protein EW026_g2927 [Hermanssonia centrifuga]|uniref:BTB domain-containing protein n=1 Tax=Hermanssonia centrifuga TaxID=98765 RepID=A0A4S4KMT2_9APHY|nr:hypothetical protein EW026_g2927 [Hermanssonia centrifuga]